MLAEGVEPCASKSLNPRARLCTPSSDLTESKLPQNYGPWIGRAGGLDALIINASGCGTTVKDYGHLFAREPGMARPAEEIAALARDVSELLWAIGLRKPSAGVPPYRVAYHDPCSMQHVQKVIEQPRALLRANRIGRTARAGAAGVAISLCDGEEAAYLRDIEKLIRMSIPATDHRTFLRQGLSRAMGLQHA